MNMRRLLMVVNEDRFFLSHRTGIALAAKQEGWDVKIVCKDTGQRRDVELLGLDMIELPINPTGRNLFQELSTFFFLYKLYKTDRNVVVHHVGLKNILWGGLAAKLVKVKGVVNAISGLGIMFSGEKVSLVSRTIMRILKYTHQSKNVRVIFQNHEDESLFLNRHIVKKEQTVFIKGSGIDLKEFQFSPEPKSDKVIIIFTARMVKEKGIIVLIDAAERLRTKYENKVEFWLCGGLSNNPNAITRDELEGMCDGKYVKWLGFQKNVRQLLEQSHIVAFPSYYREGVPKSLIEACAIGRPIVTTNSVGCRDTVEEGNNGFLVPIKNSETLAEKLQILIDNKELRCSMGMCSRRKAEREFSVDDVIKKHLSIYNRLV